MSSYEELCRSLGIDRAAISKSCSEPRHTVTSQEPTYFTLRVGERVKPPPGEDLSHMVNRRDRQISERLRAMPRRSRQPSK